MATYDLEAGRCITKDGKPWITLHKGDGVSPTEADEAARDIAAFLQGRESLKMTPLDDQPPTYEHALEAYLAMLTETHEKYFAEHYNNLSAPSFTVDPGTTFDKIVIHSSGQRSVHSFVAKVDGDSKAVGPRKRGDIMKAAGWKAPAKHPRGSIFEKRGANAIGGSGSVHYR